MKKKKQIIKDLNTVVIPSNWESAESYVVKMIVKIFVGICIAAVIVLSIFMVRSQAVKTQEQPTTMQAPKVPIMTLKNQTFLVINGVVIINVSKKEWSRLTNTFPHNLKTDDITFSR